MFNKTYDVIVIGGGLAAVHASEPLIKSGLKVAMIDGGITGKNNEIEGDFEEVRRTSNNQREFFLGKSLEGLVPSIYGGGHSSSMTGGVKSHVSEKVSELLPLESKSVFVLQSLAKGGLSEAWGGACDTFSDKELESAGMPLKEMHTSYQEIIDMIGVSGPSKYVTQGMQNIDLNARNILSKYRKLKPSKRKEFSVSEAMLALLIKKMGNRNANTYRDLDYWTNDGKSLYRAKFTIEDLEKQKNFVYMPGFLVTSVKFSSKTQEVFCKSLNGSEEVVMKSRFVIVAAGAVNTVKILANSLQLQNREIPVLVKPHVLVPCLNLKSLGHIDKTKRHSLCQLFIRDSESKRGISKSFTQIYSYKSLLLFKLLGFSPLPGPESISLLTRYVPSIVIADVRFPAFRTKEVNLLLKEDKKTIKITLSRDYTLGKDTATKLKSIRKFLRKLSLIPLKTVYTPLGSTVHYAGGAYFSDTPENLLSTKQDGSLWINDKIYLADSCTWKALPPKPPALTIMANARRIGMGLAQKLVVSDKKIKYKKN